MKMRLSIVLTVAVLFTMPGCGETGPQGDPKPESVGIESETVSAKKPEKEVAEREPVKISPADTGTLQLSAPQGVFGPEVDFELTCESSTDVPIEATVICDLVYMKDGKEVFDTMAFHDVKVEPGQSKVQVHFATLELSLEGEGTLTAYLAKRISPDPKPRCIYSMIVGESVYILDKPIEAQFKGIQVDRISNVLKIPAAP